MSLLRKMTLTLLADVAWTIIAVSASAQTCVPPPGFVDTPAPAVATAKEMVSHTEEITVARPLPVVLSAVDKPIEDTIHKTSSLPGISGDYMLTKGEFGAPGSRRLNCLSDGSTLVEQVLESERNKDSSRFRYVVWNYTSEKARPIDYGVGEFHYSDLGGGRTHIIWTYSFKLKARNFPGNLGALGRYFFRKVFLDREYADLMRGVLNETKADAERRRPGE